MTRSTSISIIGAGEGSHADNDLPDVGDYNDIVTLEGGNFDLAFIKLKDYGGAYVTLETDTQSTEADYWIGDDTSIALITDYENNDQLIVLDSDFGFSQDFASEVTWNYNAGSGQTSISINTASHNLGEVIYINGDVELEITDDGTDGSNLVIDKVRYSLDPNHQDLGWNKVDNTETLG